MKNTARPASHRMARIAFRLLCLLLSTRALAEPLTRYPPAYYFRPQALHVELSFRSGYGTPQEVSIYEILPPLPPSVIPGNISHGGVYQYALPDPRCGSAAVPMIIWQFTGNQVADIIEHDQRLSYDIPTELLTEPVRWVTNQMFTGPYVKWSYGYSDSYYMISGGYVSNPAVVPLPPSGLTATYTKDRVVELAWMDHSSNESAFILERRTVPDGEWQLVDWAEANATTYTHGWSLVAGTTYEYRTCAVGVGANSAYSNTASVTIPPDGAYYVLFRLGSQGSRTGGGELLQWVESGEAAAAPTFTTASGWVFTGWDTAFDSVEEDTTVTAHFVYTLDGDGSAAAPYRLSDCTGLTVVGTGDYTLDKHYVLTADIDASATDNGGSGFASIGSYTAPFTGVFDGQGHTITGLIINRSGEDRVGFFGTVTGEGDAIGIVRNVRFLDLSVTGNSVVAGVVGTLKSGASVTGVCCVSSDVSGGNFCGGIVGEIVSECAVSQCWFDGSVANSGSYTGGIVGYASYNSIVSQCGSSGTVVGTGNYCGGVTGHLHATALTDSYSLATVSGGTEVGGVVGSTASTTTVSRCYATGTVTGTGSVGPVVGNGTATSSFWDSETSGMAGGSSTAEMMQAATFTAAGWDFTTVWTIAEGETYPQLVGAPEPVLPSYTVVFDLGDHGTRTGGGELTQTVNHEDSATAPDLTVAEGWDFTGWDVAFDSVTGDLAVAAQYTAVVCDVTFDLGEHGTRTGGGELSQTLDYGDAATAPTFTVEDGWTFTGWDAEFDEVTSDLTVTAEYASNGEPALHWSSYLGGGTGEDIPRSVAVDGAGNAWLTGSTASGDWAVGGFDTSFNGGTSDAFVAKINADGSLAWSSYLGGTGEDIGYAISVDASGNAWVVGYTASSGWATGDYGGGSYDGFVAKINADGSLAWATYLGGAGVDHAYGVAMDASGNAWVTGQTASSDWISGGFDTSYNGGTSDAFVAKVSADGTLVWSSCLGGSGIDQGTGIALDGSGSAWAVGRTASSGWVSGGFDTSFNGGADDAFLAKIDAAGTLVWTSYLGGTDSDTGTCIALDGSGNAWVTGRTDSSSWVSGGFDTTYGRSRDGFVAKINANGTLAWSSYLGDSGNDYANAIAVDASGNGWVAGYSGSSGWASGGFDTSYNGGTADGFVAKVTTGGTLAWSSYLGGTGVDYGRGIALDASGSAWVIGYTASSDWVSGGFDTSYNGGIYDAFIAKVGDSSPATHTVTFDLGEHGTRTGGGALAQTVEDGDAATAPEFTVEDGWTFTGWDAEFDEVTSDLTVTALYAVDPGSRWLALGSGMDNYVMSLAIDGAGTLYAGGGFTTAAGVAVNCVAKWDGSSWSALGSGMNSVVYAVAVDGAGNLYAGGDFTTAGGVAANRVAKWDGSSWSALGAGMNVTVCALALDDAGNLYAGGAFTTAGGASAYRIAKWNGSSWSALGSGMNADVNALAVDGAGNLYAGGYFTTAGGVAASRVAKWNGSSWSALGSGTTNDNVFALAFDDAGVLYAGGAFTTVVGVSVNHIAQWDGSSWSSLGSGMDSTVRTLAFDDGTGSLYAGGYFTTAGGVSANRIAEWNGSSWSALGSGMNDIVRALAPDGSGLLYAGGYFTTAGEANCNRVAAWSAAVPANTYTVTFDLGDHGTRTGGGALSQTVEDGDAATAPTFTVQDGWTFTGWDTEFDEVTSDLTVTAEYAASGSVGPSWSTYLGGSSDDLGSCVVADAAGNAWVGGSTGSATWVTGGYDTSYGGGTYDGFVAKVNADGTLAWATYLGGSGNDHVTGVALDAAGDVWVAGWTMSSDWVSGGFDITMNGTEDAFVVKLHGDGTLVWSSYLGGSSEDRGGGIALDADGNAWVTGHTASSGWVSGGWDTSFGGGYWDAFVAKVNADGSLGWSSYIGGSGLDQSVGIAVDGMGAIWVAMQTASSGLATGGYDTTYGGGGYDGFVAKISPEGTLAWSSYLGGSATDYCHSLAVDTSGRAWIGGYTESDGWVSGGFDTSRNGDADAFLVVVEGDGTLAWSTYLGGSAMDYCNGLAFDAGGNAWLTGPTSSSDWVAGGFDTGYNGGDRDAFVAVVTAAGALDWSSYLGGSEADHGRGIAASSSGDVWVTGYTESSGWTSDGFDTAYGGSRDAFLVKMAGGWTPATHTVTFGLGDHGTRTGGGALTQAVDHGDAATAPTFAVEDGWTFTGWDTAFDDVTSDLTVTAEYAVATYTVTFDLGDHGTRTGGGALTQTVDHGDAAAAPIFTVGTGWTFTGWDEAFDEVTSDLTVTAEYAVATYTVTFDLGDHGARTGGGALTQTVDHGDAATAPTFTVEDGWTFTGWDEEFDEVTSDLTVTAEYAVATYIVTFDLGDHGTRTGGGALTQTVDHGDAATAPTFTVEDGWTFAGWDEEFDEVTSDLAVAAQYASADLPEVAWGTYLGGSAGDSAEAVAVAPDGSIYVAGYTQSDGWVGGGPDASFGGTGDAFVAKFSPTGVYLWSTFVGEYNGISALAVAPDGSVCVAGSAGEPATWVSGGYDTTYGGTGGAPYYYGDGFAAKLDADGDLLWSTLLGGTGSERASAVAVAADGSIYVSGQTTSAGWISGGSQTTYLGGCDAFLVKLGGDGSHQWSTYVGGTGVEDASYVAVAADGTVCVAGLTESAGWASGGYDTTHNGGRDGFVATYSAAGAPLWSTYVGGSGSDVIYGIATAADGSVYVTGLSATAGWVSGGYDTAYGGGDDAFVVKISAAGAHLWSTYLGGSGRDLGASLVVGSDGSLFVGGRTQSAGWVSGGPDASYGGAQDGFLAKLAPDGSHLWSSYAGGDAADGVAGLALSKDGSLYAAGATETAGWLAEGWDTTQNGNADGLLLKIANAQPASAYTVTFDLGDHGTRTGGGELTQTVEDGDAATAPTFTVEDGWTFAGWDTEFDEVTGDLTVTAEYGQAYADLYVDDTAAGTGTGLNWANALTSLQSALDAATSGTTIHVAAGVYKPSAWPNGGSEAREMHFSLSNGVTILGGYPDGGGERNHATNVTVLSGDIGVADDPTDNCFHVLYLPDGLDLDGTAILDGFVVTGGQADAGGHTVGGALCCAGSSPTLSNCAFIGNYASYSGGAVCCYSSAASFSNCQFAGNSTLTGTTNVGFGGALFAGGGSTLSVVNTTLQGNVGQYGGGLFSENSSQVTFVNCTFEGNNAGMGAAVYSHSSSATTVSNCILWGTSSQVYNYAGTTTVTYSCVYGGYSGTGNISGDPLFVDATGGDLHLQPNSPCLDTGSNAAVTATLDADGNQRIVNDTVDMGAYERESAASTHNVVFDLGDHGTRTGGGALTQTVDHGDAATAPTFTVDDGWAFTGWDAEFDEVTADLTVTAEYAQTFVLTVTAGTGGGSYAAGASVAVTADAAPTGETFAEWTVSPTTYAANLADASAASTTFTMPAAAATLTATYEDAGDDPFGDPEVYIGTPMTVLVQATRSEGDIETGDVVGAFVDEELRGKTPVVFVDDEAYANLTVYVDGDGEDIEFKLYDASADEVVEGNRTVTGAVGGSLGTLAEPVEVVFGLATLTVNLAAGWNQVSLNLHPADPSCDTVFAGLGALLLKAIGGGGNYTPGWGALNTLTEFEDGLGYWVRVSAATTWTVEGTLLDADETPIALAAGWNHVAFIGASASTVDGALAGIMDDLDKVVGDGANYTPGWGALNTLTTMRPGLGYWVKVSSATTLTYGFAAPSSRESAAVGRSAPGWSAEQPDPPSTAHTIMTSVTLDDNAVADGSLLGVFVDDECRAVGEMISLNGISYFNLTVLMGSAGETAEFRLYDAASDTILDTDFTFTLSPGSSDGTPDEPVEIAFEGAVVQHAVTFAPGLHGTLAGGSPNVVVTVDDGDPVPTAPVVTAAEGWTHTGWDWTSSTRGDAPATVTTDWTATALYEETTGGAPAWEMTLAIADGSPSTLTFGMRSDATDGWDAGVDEQYPLPGPGQACLASDDLALSYASDYRALQETGEFLLLASATDESDLAISWDASGLPDGKYLTIYEVAMDGISPSRDGADWTLVGNTARDMALVDSLEIPAGETRCYVLRYGDDLVFDLAFGTGWNMVSLPIEPLDSSVEAVLDDGATRAETDADLRDGFRGTITAGTVWTWGDRSYVDVEEMHACVGYWVHATEAAILLIPGLPVDQESLALLRGWNLSGTEIPRATPEDARIVGCPWEWNLETLRYSAATSLLPGLGYWINVSEDCVLDLE